MSLGTVDEIASRRVWGCWKFADESRGLRSSRVHSLVLCLDLNGDGVKLLHLVLVVGDNVANSARVEPEDISAGC
jgi:hypothetical protein